MQLNNLIKEEVERSLELEEVFGTGYGSFPKRDDEHSTRKRLADRGPHIGGGVSKTDPGAFDYDKGEDEVYEEGPTLGAASYNKRDDEESEIVEGDNDDWIQGAEKDIEKRGTEGVCTGDKFGGPSCRKGTKRYNLAKTFKKMARDKKSK